MADGISHVLQHENYDAQAKKVSPQGYDLIIDSIGGPNIEISQTLLNPCGRLVIIGNYNFNICFNYILILNISCILLKYAFNRYFQSSL